MQRFQIAHSGVYKAVLRARADPQQGAGAHGMAEDSGPFRVGAHAPCSGAQTGSYLRVAAGWSGLLV